LGRGLSNVIPSGLESAKTALKRLLIGRLRRQDAVRRARLPREFGGLPPSLWGYHISPEGELCVEGLRIREVLSEFGSPLHAVNIPWLRKTHDDFVRPFQLRLPRTRLATSYKTNPVPAVISALHECGTYAEVISHFELWLASRLGLPGERVIVNGPGKTRAMLADAVRMGVKVINIDGPGEIDLIAAEAERLGRRQPVGVRVVSSVGWSSQFGLSIASGDALAAFERILQRRSLIPVGLHLHIGTGLKSVALYLQAIREVLLFARTLRERCGIEVSIYDLGGGYGVPTVRGTDEWDDRMVALGYPAREAIPSDCPSPEEYASRIAALFSELLAQPAHAEIVLEPGRAITSGAQTLLLTVIAVKESGGVRKLMLDGGKNITLPLGWETHKILPTANLNRPFDAQCDLYGPLCHPGDIVARHLKLPKLEVGDSVAVMDAGAYFVPNQMNFSNPRPAIIAIAAGRARLVRRRESFDDIVRLDDLD
jgi:diaminopimelate decarboxylase